MRMGKGVGGLLILLEAVLLVAVSVLGAVKGLGNGMHGNHETASVHPAVSEQPIGTEYIDEISDSDDTEDEQESQTVSEPETAAGTDGFSEEVKQQLASMTIEQKIAQMFLVSPESLTENELVTIAGEGTKNALAEYPVGGLVYSEENFQGRQQFGALLAGAQRYSKQQNGAYLILAAAGEGEDGGLIFSDVYDAGPLTEAVAEGIPSAGMPIIGMPTIGMEKIQAAEKLSPEENGSDITMLSYEELMVTSDLAAEEVIQTYPDGEAAVLAIEAGADFLYITSDFKTAYEAVLAAVEEGRISSERIDNAAGKILTRKEAMPAPQDGDIAAENEPQNPPQDNNDNNADNAAENELQNPPQE